MTDHPSTKVPKLIIAPSSLGIEVDKYDASSPDHSSTTMSITSHSTTTTAREKISMETALKKRHKLSLARLELVHSRELEEVQAKAEQVLQEHGEKWRKEQQAEMDKLQLEHAAELERLKRSQASLLLKHNAEMGELRAKYYEMKNKVQNQEDVSDASSVLADDGGSVDRQSKTLSLEKKELQDQLVVQERELELMRTQLKELTQKLAKEQQSHVRHMTEAKKDYMKQRNKFRKKLERLESGQSLCSLQENSVVSDLTSLPVMDSARSGLTSDSKKSSKSTRKLMKTIASLAEKAKAEDEKYDKNMEKLTMEIRILKAGKNKLKKKLAESEAVKELLTHELEATKTDLARVKQELEQEKAKPPPPAVSKRGLRGLFRRQRMDL